MDTRNGSIHEFSDNKAIAAYLEDTKGKPSDLVPVEGEPVPECGKCKGTGRVRKGMHSKRWKPCKCTYREEDHKTAHANKVNKERNSYHGLD